MIMRGVLGLAAVLFTGLSSPAAAQSVPSEGSIGPIEARLLYRESGEISGNVLVDGQFSNWNLLIESQEFGGVDDVVIIVPFRAPDSGDYDDGAMTITVTDSDGAVLYGRDFPPTISGTREPEFRALWLNDATCMGTMTVTASMGALVRTAKLELLCGE